MTGEVWLSTDDVPANAKMTCNVEGWMNYQRLDVRHPDDGHGHKSSAGS